MTADANPKTEPLMSPKQLAAYLGVPHKTIYEWRRKGTGPRGFRVGRHVRFRMKDVGAWLAENADAVSGDTEAA